MLPFGDKWHAKPHLILQSFIILKFDSEEYLDFVFLRSLVDANVLIFERIREELRLGNTPQASIYSGYSKALGTIADANITTFIAAIVLFGFGTGPIQGFAVTLMIGIASSMFTAIFGTRAVINLIYGSKQVSRLAI